MTGEFMIGVLNTSVVTGLSIAAAGLILRVSWKNYSAKCRKRIWIFLAFCLLIPFHLLQFSGAYTAEIPNVALREFDGRAADRAGAQEAADSEAPSTQNQTKRIQAAADPSLQMSRRGDSGAALTAADVFFAVWMCVCVLLAAYYTAGYWKMRSGIRRQSSGCEDEHVQRILREIAAECRIKKIPEVCIMKDSDEGPFATGILKNLIILPEEALSGKDLRFILKHEMIHCRNHDISWRLFFLAVNVIHWFNPLVWYLRRAMEQDMEIACDEEVVARASREKRREYSEVIMAWVERSRYRGNAVSTGYVKGIGFLKRRFDSILNGGKKKNGLLLAGGVCILALFSGCMIRLQGGKAYAEKKIPVGYGYEVRTDVDGDGETDRVFVTDNNLDGWDSVNTSVSVTLSNGQEAWISYPDRWQSCLVTGDLTGNGAADIVLVKHAWMSNHGTGDVTVLHVEEDAAGKPEWVEYPGNFIQNPDLEPEWAGGWEDYPYPEDISLLAEAPIALDDACYGAAIIEKDGRTMLRVIRMADAETDSGMCIDCSYTPEGWYIEDIQMIYDYYGGDWDEKLLGTWNLEPEANISGEDSAVFRSGEGAVLDRPREASVNLEDFWTIETKEDNTVKFVTGLAMTAPDEWSGNIVYETESDDRSFNRLLVCEKGNADAGLGGIIFCLEYVEYTETDPIVLMDGDIVFGLYEQGGREYALLLTWPGDRQYSEDDQALIDAYMELNSMAEDVIVDTDKMSHFTQKDLSELEGIIYESDL